MGVGAFGGRVGTGVGGRGRCDVGDYVVHTDRFAGCEGTEGDLDLGHGVGGRVGAGVFAEFLGGRVSLVGVCGKGRGKTCGEDNIFPGWDLLFSHLLG